MSAQHAMQWAPSLNDAPTYWRRRQDLSSDLQRPCQDIGSQWTCRTSLLAECEQLPSAEQVNRPGTVCVYSIVRRVQHSFVWAVPI